MFALIANVAKNIIAQYHGAIADIPVGWALCDGTLGTPDLRDKFVIGVSATHLQGMSYGSLEHSHDFTGIQHKHVIDTGDDIAAGTGYADETKLALGSGGIEEIDLLPPCLALAYIMKL